MSENKNVSFEFTEEELNEIVSSITGAPANGYESITKNKAIYTTAFKRLANAVAKKMVEAILSIGNVTEAEQNKKVSKEGDTMSGPLAVENIRAFIRAILSFDGLHIGGLNDESGETQYGKDFISVRRAMNEYWGDGEDEHFFGLPQNSGTLATEEKVRSLLLEEFSKIDFIKPVKERPAVGEPNCIYLVSTGSEDEENLFEMWLWVNKGTEEAPSFGWEFEGCKKIGGAGNSDNSNIVNGEGVGSIKSSNTKDDNGANYSTIVGYGENALPEASGHEAFAMGKGAKARGKRSFAFGSGALATGVTAVAIGQAVQATNNGALAFGNNTEASGEYSTATGQQTVAKGSRSFAGGWKNKANKAWSVAFGVENTVGSDGTADGAGQGAFVAGMYNVVDGYVSAVFGTHNISKAQKQLIAGYKNTASKAFQTVLGYYNSNKEDTLLEVGNGEDGKPSNAFEVYKSGYAKAGRETTDDDDDLVLATKGYARKRGGGTQLYRHRFKFNSVTYNFVTSKSTPYSIVPFEEGNVIDLNNDTLMAWVDKPDEGRVTILSFYISQSKYDYEYDGDVLIGKHVGVDYTCFSNEDWDFLDDGNYFSKLENHDKDYTSYVKNYEITKL